MSLDVGRPSSVTQDNDRSTTVCTLMGGGVSIKRRKNGPRYTGISGPRAFGPLPHRGQKVGEAAFVVGVQPPSKN
jgi:hypothetical protein